MTIRRGLAAALLAAALLVLQLYGLNRMPEKIEEDRYTQIADIPAGDLVPTYIASLFFGSFRAVVIDALWIYLSRLERDKRWYERREVLKVISYFQPRNPEVAKHLGWHSAYNVANGFTQADKAWEWTRFGLEWLRDSITRMPLAPDLKFELAFTLFHKPSWKTGTLDMPLLKRIELDTELQERLQDRKPILRRMSAFELAIPWLEKARDELKAFEKGYMYTLGGLLMAPDSMDGFIQKCQFLQGMYLWNEEHWDEAREWFRRAGLQAEKILRDYPDRASPIFSDHATFDRGLLDVVEHDRAAKGGRREDEQALLAAMEKIVLLEGVPSPLDEEFLWSRTRPEARLNRLKRKFARDQDLHEYNDDFRLYTPAREGTLIQANLDPEGRDVDYYLIYLPNPVKNAPPEARPAKPIPVTLRFSRPDPARTDLKVTVFDASKKPLVEAPIRGRGEMRLEARAFGVYFVKVEPLAPTAPWPADTRYNLLYVLGE